MKQKSLLKLLSVILLLCLLVSGCSQGETKAETETETESDTVTETETDTDTANLYTPGRYTASASGYGGNLEVSVEVDAAAILTVDVVSHNETDGVGTKAIEALPSEIVKAQSTQVDAVSGATSSSNAILTAVNAALEQARGNTQTAEVSFTPGVYTAAEYGNNGYLNVEVEVDASQIISVTVPEHTETKFLGDTAIEQISEDIVTYQTLNVDSISGATVTSNALKAAVTNCIEQAGGNASALQDPVPAKGVKKDEVTQVDADVIIVGAGGAGLSAAVTAAEAGSNVIVIEKMPVIGGNTVRSASAYNTADPDQQASLPMTDTLKATIEKELSKEPVNEEHAQLIADVRSVYDAYLLSDSQTLFDCPEWHALQTYTGGDAVGDVELIRKYAENTLSTLNWIENLGAPLTDKISQGAGALWQRTHQFDAPAGTGMIEPLYNRAMELGVEIVTMMCADSLIMSEDNIVTGVIAYDAYDSEYHYTASQGVILATGGYSNNKEMRSESDPTLTDDMVSTNQPGATGDGINMAAAIGAGTTGMDYVQVYPLATPGSGALQGRARKMSGLDSVIVVNKEGLRFINEDARRDDFVAAIKEQTDSLVYEINDSRIVEEYNSFNENVETLIEVGRIYKADTLEELAELLDMPAENLEATVAAFNEMVANSEDTEFGRTLFADTIEVGPFYATARAPSIHHTMGGLTINTDAQVLREDGTVIEGLYAAGEVTGGIHGSNRLGGNATADALTFGRIAGTSVSSK